MPMIKTNNKLINLEKFCNDNTIIQLSSIHSIFLNLEENDFIEYTNHLLLSNNYDQMNLFLYFLMLFKYVPKVQKILNSQMIPLPLIERLVLFSYYFYLKKDEKNSNIFISTFYFLDQDRLLDLLINSENISKDLLLIFSILIQFDTKHIDDYFKLGKNIKLIANGFVLLPVNLIKDILFYNVNLFDFLLSIIPLYVGEKEIEDFNKKYSGEIELARGIKKFAKLNAKLIEQKNKNISDDNFLRIALLVQIVQKLKSGNSEILLKYTNTDKLLISETEKLLAFEIILNPLFKDIREKISRIDILNSLNEKEEECIFFNDTFNYNNN